MLRDFRPSSPKKSQGYRLFSPDTILKTLSDKTEEDTFVQSGEGNRYKFSINAGLSGLLLVGMLKSIEAAIELKYSQCLQQFLNYKRTYENRNNRVIA